MEVISSHLLASGSNEPPVGPNNPYWATYGHITNSRKIYGNYKWDAPVHRVFILLQSVPQSNGTWCKENVEMTLPENDNGVLVASAYTAQSGSGSYIHMRTTGLYGTGHEMTLPIVVWYPID